MTGLVAIYTWQLISLPKSTEQNSARPALAMISGDMYTGSQIQMHSMKSGLVMREDIPIIELDVILSGKNLCHTEMYRNVSRKAETHVNHGIDASCNSAK